MRPFPLAALLAAACGPKAPPTPASDVPQVPPAPPPAVTEAVPPPPTEPPPLVENADFHVAITTADGRTLSGHVVRIERAIDFTGAAGWTDREMKLKVGLHRDGTSRDADWSEISEIRIAYPDTDADVSCSYDSATRPWVYTCTLPTTSTATTTDGETWEVTSRQKWRLFLDGADPIELWLYKLPAHQADEASRGYGTENHALYQTLRARVMEAAATAPVHIAITP